MSRAVMVLASAAIGLLMWAALDDLTTGDEASYLSEGLVVALGSLWFRGVVKARLRRLRS